jgi:hypothetical protein
MVSMFLEGVERMRALGGVAVVVILLSLTGRALSAPLELPGPLESLAAGRKPDVRRAASPSTARTSS